MFQFVLKIAAQKKLLSGKQVGVDSTTLEANAAMRSIVRKDNGDDWKTYLRKLAAAEGVEIDNDEDLRRFDQKRRKEGKKKVSNDEWQSPVDPDARIGQMKDGRTHLNYKAEHVVDLDSEIVVQADVHHGNSADSQTVIGSLVDAQVNLDQCFDGVETTDDSIGAITEVADQTKAISPELSSTFLESASRWRRHKSQFRSTPAFKPREEHRMHS